MQVKKIGENRVDIYLNREEIYDIFGGYEFIDYDEKDCRTKIHGLLAAAIPSVFLPIDCNKVFIEIKPLSFGCAISLTKLYIPRSPLKKDAKTVTMIFENSDSLIQALKALKSLPYTTSKLYNKGKKYALICKIKQHDEDKLIHLSEYCKVAHTHSNTIRIKEYWNPVCEHNAIEKLAAAFLK